VVSCVRRRTARRPRVYTFRTALLGVVLAVIALRAGGAGAQPPVDITVEPTMVKGAPDARVTIVEFSDYQ
jgi:hypothetical protein